MSGTVVAIDGPAGAGKSTVARALSRRLGFGYLDTGALYRCVGLAARQQGVAWADTDRLGQVAATVDVRFGELDDDLRQTVVLNGVDVTQAIRQPEASEAAAVVSAVASVRAALVVRQRQFREGSRPGIVVEGRDIGSVIFPDAEVKVFLTASAETRARRRFTELCAAGGQVDYDTILGAQIERDHLDATRAVSPLRPAPDALELCTDGLSIEQVVARIAERVPRTSAAP